MPDRLTPQMGLDFWFSLAPLPWGMFAGVVLLALIAWLGAVNAHRLRGPWRVIVLLASFANLSLAIFNAMVMAHDDAVGRCLIVLQSIY